MKYLVILGFLLLGGCGSKFTKGDCFLYRGVTGRILDVGKKSYHITFGRLNVIVPKEEADVIFMESDCWNKFKKTKRNNKRFFTKNGTTRL